MISYFRKKFTFLHFFTCVSILINWFYLKFETENNWFSDFENYLMSSKYLPLLPVPLHLPLEDDPKSVRLDVELISVDEEFGNFRTVISNSIALNFYCLKTMMGRKRGMKQNASFNLPAKPAVILPWRFKEEIVNTVDSDVLNITDFLWIIFFFFGSRMI